MGEETRRARFITYRLWAQTWRPWLYCRKEPRRTQRTARNSIEKNMKSLDSLRTVCGQFAGQLTSFFSYSWTVWTVIHETTYMCARILFLGTRVCACACIGTLVNCPTVQTVQLLHLKDLTVLETVRELSSNRPEILTHS